MKKILVYLGLFILMLPIIFAPGLATCDTDDGTTTSAAFTGVDELVDESITLGTDQIFGSILNLTPTTLFNFTTENGYNESSISTLSDLNSTNTSLFWPLIDPSSVIVTNSTGGVLGAGNYTVFATPGIIWWNISNSTFFGNNSAGDYMWNETIVYIYYNKSFLALETDLVALGLGYDEGAAPTYGGTKTWGLTRPELNNTDWTMFYIYTTRTCSARDSCLATRATVFAGFALIAVAMIVLSAFGIIKLITGDMTGAALGVIAITIIGLAVIIMIGYYITSTVGESVCNAAVA